MKDSLRFSYRRTLLRSSSFRSLGFLSRIQESLNFVNGYLEWLLGIAKPSGMLLSDRLERDY